MKWLPRVLVVVGAVLMIAPAVQAADDYSDLLGRVPESANAVLIVDIQGLVKSPLGTKEGWARKHQSEYLAGALMFPPTIERLVVGAQIGGGNPGGNWVVGLMPSKRALDMNRLAKDEGSDVDNIGGLAAVHSRRDAYFVELSSNLLGVMNPANRQEVSRWLRTAKRGGKANLSPYLTDAVAWPRDGQVLFAVDMEDMLHPRGLRNWLDNCKKLGGNKADIDRAHKLIMSLRGVKFLARVTDKIQGQLYLDFAEKIELKDAAVLKPVLQEGLAELGASVEEVTGGKASTEGRSLIIEAEMTPLVLRRILSLIQVPAPSHGSVADSVPIDEDPVLFASKRYYQSVQSLLEELKDLNNRAYNSGMVIRWYETYSQKIDQLPLVNVDKELLQYGSSVANKLRQLGASLSGQNIQVNLLQSYKRTNVYASGGSYYGNAWGGYGYTGRSARVESNAADVYTARNEAVAAGRLDRNKIWQSIDEDTAEVRKAMAEKFKVDFNAK